VSISRVGGRAATAYSRGDRLCGLHGRPWPLIDPAQVGCERRTSHPAPQRCRTTRKAFGLPAQSSARTPCFCLLHFVKRAAVTTGRLILRSGFSIASVSTASF